MTYNLNKQLILEIQFSSKDKIKGVKLPTKLSNELAYLCGIFTGDGNLYYRQVKYDYSLKCVGNPKDEQKHYLEIIGPYFKNVFGFLPKIKFHDSKTTFGFVIYSKAVFTFLTKIIGLPYGKKYASLKIPPIFKENEELIIPFIKGLMDTDGCISFKKKYKIKPYYPVISLSSKSKNLIKEVGKKLKELGFKIVETYDYKIIDKRTKMGFTFISRLELNGKDNFKKWMSVIGFSSPKHLEKIKKYWKEDSGRRI